ncbi:maleylpyruvate isomerase family mycothiol-dependent enzyme [Actinoallomurus soli]|uniref:maleylpyruvate isomerase family mycothiol-dependent enzyme n=1 Tax=Actinoallomurus soli TaxID=2952535 RepID=UPI002091F1CC|nr:maleylpyruvate isomerase family mycothiol-dependent enzyme [Actinoallomurus soli]MCO5971493.1 maleylpyruvate isomerase family mycothiol-dependent enzyme [Actinoallomurus soli]
MEPSDFLTRLRAESAHIAAFAADRDLGAPVPTCPGMNVGDLVRHLGSVYLAVIDWVHAQSRPDDWDRRPSDGDVIRWFRACAAELHDELSRRPVDEPCDTWSPGDRTIGFWWRRMAHETTVHRVDVEAAYGPIGPVDAEFAADGADEVLSLYLVRRFGRRDRGRPASVRTVGVAAGSRVWRVTISPTSAEVISELPDDADAVVIGDPVPVYLWLWGRRGDDAIRVRGDRAAAADLRAALAAATD